MVQVIPQTPTFGESFGAGLGQGLSQGLTQSIDDFFQNKRQERQVARQQAQLDQFFNSPQGEGLSDLEKHLLKGEATGFLPKGAANTILTQQRKREEQEFLNRILGADDRMDAVEAASQNSSRLSQMPEDQLLALAGRGGNAANVVKLELDRRKLQAENQKRRAEFEYKRAAPILERADELRETLPIKENALTSMEDAFENGNQSYFSGNNLAELTGIEAFRDPAGAQAKAAGKEFFLGDISRAGARPNQWIEQQIADAQPKIGRDRASNMVVLAAMRFKVDVERKRLELMDQLEEKYENELGFVPAKIGREVSKQLKPYVEERQDQLKKQIEDIKKEEGKGKKKKVAAPKGRVQMINPDTGEDLFVDEGDIDAAKAEGFNVVK